MVLQQTFVGYMYIFINQSTLTDLVQTLALQTAPSHSEINKCHSRADVRREFNLLSWKVKIHINIKTVLKISALAGSLQRQIVNSQNHQLNIIVSAQKRVS